MTRIVVLAVLVGVTLTSRDARAENWRDGCPAGRLAGYGYTRANALGATSSTSTALLPARISSSTGFAYLTSRSGLARDRIIHERLDGAIAGLPAGLVFNASLPMMYRLATDRRAGEVGVGNLTLAAGLRRMYITQLDGKADVDPDHLIANLRRAWSAQLIGSIRGWHDDDLQRLQDDALRSPFEHHDLGHTTVWGPLSNVGVRAEYRLELVGCYAPFIHLTTAPVIVGDGAVRDDPWFPHGVFVPAYLTLGLEVATRTSLYVEYAIGVRGDRTYTTPQRWHFVTNHRIRVGGEYFGGRHVRVGLALDFFTGTQDGAFVNVTFAVQKAYR